MDKEQFEKLGLIVFSLKEFCYGLAWIPMLVF